MPTMHWSEWMTQWSVGEWSPELSRSIPIQTLSFPSPVNYRAFSIPLDVTQNGPLHSRGYFNPHRYLPASRSLTWGKNAWKNSWGLMGALG